MATSARNRMTPTQRAVQVFLLREAGLSYPTIGRRLGIRHTTALYAQRRAVRLLRDDVDFGVLVDEARQARTETINPEATR